MKSMLYETCQSDMYTQLFQTSNIVDILLIVKTARQNQKQIVLANESCNRGQDQMKPARQTYVHLTINKSKHR